MDRVVCARHRHLQHLLLQRKLSARPPIDLLALLAKQFRCVTDSICNRCTVRDWLLAVVVTGLVQLVECTLDLDLVNAVLFLPCQWRRRLHAFRLLWSHLSFHTKAGGLALGEVVSAEVDGLGMGVAVVLRSVAGIELGSTAVLLVQVEVVLARLGVLGAEKSIGGHAEIGLSTFLRLVYNDA